MQKLNLSYQVNSFERLFIDKGVELLFKNSIDSYRLRLHNPITLIEELISVCQSSMAGFLTNNDYATATAKELSEILEDEDHGLNFIKVTKKHYRDILTKPNNSNYGLLVQSSKLLLKDNQNYIKVIFDKIIAEFALSNALVNDGSVKYLNDLTDFQKRILVLTNHFFVGLVNKGYNKHYLSNFFQITFIQNRVAGRDFNARMRILETLTSRTLEDFTVIFEIEGSAFQIDEFKRIDSSYELVTKQYRATISSKVSDKVNLFLETNNKKILIYIKVKSLDYFKAIEIATDKISKDLDIYHLGYTKHSIKIGEKCAVIGSNDPSKSSTFPSNFQIDGYVRSGADVFDILLKKIEKIKKNDVDIESYDKILSAIRYYRTGSEAAELETKLLNYWIGLEYIFTSSNAEMKTIERIRTLFPVCHSLIYIKRNLWDFHNTIRRLEIDNLIPDYDDDLIYLTKYASYKNIIDNSPNELLKFRANYFRTWVENPANIESAIRNHKTNITWNLTRLYRIRNEIVHNAAIKRGIYVHISHIKYYLTFVLNSILDFMADTAVDTDNDGKISIEDYFIAQEIMAGSLKGTTLKNYIRVENPSQIIH